MKNTMHEPYLEVTFRHGRPMAAYYYLPRAAGAKSARSRRAEGGLVIDYAESGEPLGIEITSPSTVTRDALNAVLSELGVQAIGEAEFAPLCAA
jgi:hypothetical protein